MAQRLRETEEALYRELREEKEKITCDFDEERIGLWDYIRRGRISYGLTAPVIYGMIVPAAILDLSVTIYQAVCFPVYGIPKVRRRDYIADLLPEFQAKSKVSLQ
ncbi:hypothetical protein [Nitratifractor sp.]